jgi:DtxR family Mn-dependent transcriptional regulator
MDSINSLTTKGSLVSGELIDTTEMYLKTVFELHEAGVAPLRARIAERLGHSGPTVSQTVARMERDGLLHLDDQRRIRLTEQGSAVATDVMRKHRLAERHLLDVIGLDYSLVHEEACRWEHVMSREVEERIAAQIAPPYLDPYGNPIPGLEDLGIAGASESAVTVDGKGLPNRGVELPEVIPANAEGRVQLLRIGESAQSDPAFLEDLARHGMLPGNEMGVDRVADSFLLRGADGVDVAIPLSVAGQLYVTPIAAE